MLGSLSVMNDLTQKTPAALGFPLEALPGVEYEEEGYFQRSGKSALLNVFDAVFSVCSQVQDLR